jgi:hypothetical protein
MKRSRLVFHSLVSANSVVEMSVISEARRSYSSQARFRQRPRDVCAVSELQVCHPPLAGPRRRLLHSGSEDKGNGTVTVGEPDAGNKVA